MRYALNLPCGGPSSDPNTLGEFAEVAEDAGWDAVFLEDYIVYQGHDGVPTSDPWICLAAMATRTSRIRLGTLVTPLARRRPWKVAREATTLDHLSEGRVTLGVGLGDAAMDTSFSSFGEELDARVRSQMLDEGLEIIAGLWSGEPFAHVGTHFEVQEARFLPRPVQTPRIPIWVGGAFPNRGPMRRATRWDGANFFYRAATPGSAESSVRSLTVEEFTTLRDYVSARRSPKSAFDFVVSGPRHPRDPDAELVRLRACAAAGATWSQVWVAPGKRDEMRADIAAGPSRID